MNTVIKIEKYDHEGRGIGYLNNKVIFVPNTIKDDEVEITITNEKKNYLEANVLKVVKPSPKRIKSICPYFEKCGGCTYQIINHEEELKIKKDNLIDIFNKYSKISISPEIIKSKENNYRNKIELKIENNTFGYYNASSHDFIKIDYCYLAKESINNIINNQHLFNIKNGDIIIRSNYNDEILIKINTKDKYNIDVDSLTKTNKIIGIIVNNKIIYGEEDFIEKIDNYYYKVNINSFFQVNLDIIKEVFNILKQKDYKNVVDLYCGVGTLGIPITKQKLYGIEVSKESIENALINNKMNHQNNLYMLGDSSNISKIKDEIDTIIVDPPRSGLNKETINNLLSFNSQEIIYMSCYPTTLARDINILKEKYNITKTYLLDMFPRTKHCETITFMKRKKNNE